MSWILSLRVIWRKVFRHLVKEVLRQVRRSMRKGKIVLKSEGGPWSQSEWYKEMGQCEMLAGDTQVHATQYVTRHLNTMCFCRRSPSYVNGRQHGGGSPKIQRKAILHHILQQSNATLFSQKDSPFETCDISICSRTRLEV